MAVRGELKGQFSATYSGGTADKLPTKLQAPKISSGGAADGRAKL
jgi:hypothetical protein